MLLLRISVGIAMVVVTETARADDLALPTLDRFLGASERYAPNNQEARAIAKEREAQGTQAVDRLLPTFSAIAAYTRNQYNVVATFPSGTGAGLRSVTLTPDNQLDATLAIDAPLLDVGNFGRISSARADQRASAAQAAATSQNTARDVGRAYYQLVAASAVIASAEHALSTSEQNLRTVESRLAGGLASELDAHRARAEIERNRKAVADARLLRMQAARKIHSLSGLDPNGEAPDLPQGTEAEAPLQGWLGEVEGLPAVRASAEQARSAEALAHAAVAAFVPSIAGRASERFTNAAGFGFSPAWAAGVTATWRVDIGALAAVHAQDAAVEASTAALGRSRQEARDAIEDAYDQVETERTTVTAARAEESASVNAAQVARVRYDAGTATHLELLEAERDAFSAEVSRVQAEADLAYARFALHVAAGRIPGAAR